MAVTPLVLEDGGDEDEAIAALLHDSVEDQGGHVRLEEIRGAFGDRVAKIVASCSDADTVPKPPWRPRKEAYIKHLRNEASSEVRGFSLADKLHNARTMLVDYYRVGDVMWDRFSAPKEDQLWLLRALVNAFQATAPGAMTRELDRVVSELERLASGLNR